MRAPDWAIGVVVARGWLGVNGKAETGRMNEGYGTIVQLTEVAGCGELEFIGGKSLASACSVLTAIAVGWISIWRPEPP